MQAITDTVSGGLRELQGGMRTLGALRDGVVVLGATAAALWAAHRIVHAVAANAPGGVVV